LFLVRRCSLDGAADLVVAADDRVELALARTLGQVDGVFGQGLAIGLALGARDVLAAAHGVDRGFQRLSLQARVAQDAAGLALVVGQGQQKELAGDIGVAALGGFLVGAGEHGLQIAAALHVVAALDLRQAFQRRVDRGLQPVDGHAGAREQARRAALGIAQQGGQHVHGLDIGIVISGCQTLGVGQRLLELGGKFVESHSGGLASVMSQPPGRLRGAAR